ncbi:MAG: cation transporter [Ruminiclostridium sp.]|nr:cation transporter [Ruminiclostridium sp.]
MSVFKLVVGIQINAHAVLLDAVNGLSDSLSSVLAIASSWLSGLRPNKKHPMGYGRVEYLFSMLITAIIMLIGAHAMIEAVDGILDPHEAPDYNTYTLVIMVTSLVFKLSYGIVMRRKGKEIRSAAMIMTGTDSLGDSLTSIGILAAMLIYGVTGVDLEHYVCIAISCMIFFTGIQLLRQSLDKILGTRTDADHAANIRRLLIMEEGVLNINNLVIHSYGENRYVGSADIEVDENMKASDIAKLSRRLIRHAASAGLTLTSVGISGANISDPEAARIWDNILEIAGKDKCILRLHSFIVDFEEKVISFYVVLDYGMKEREKHLEQFRYDINALCPDMTLEIIEGIDM